MAYAIGIAWSLKHKGNSDSKVYVFIGDGECGEGSVWEAASIASHLKLNNIVTIIDKNDLQIDGWVRDINSQEAICDRWRSFGFDVVEINGHNYDEIKQAFSLEVKEHPKAIIAHTIKGKGLSFVENRTEWHQNVVTDELYEKGLAELRNYEIYRTSNQRNPSA